MTRPLPTQKTEAQVARTDKATDVICDMPNHLRHPHRCPPTNKYEGLQAWVHDTLGNDGIELVVQPRPKFLPQWAWDKIIARTLLIREKTTPKEIVADLLNLENRHQICEPFETGNREAN